MVTVNQSRSEMNHQINRVTDDAKMIGFNNEGEACVWYGGVTFNIYDAARDWQELRCFTSMKLARDSSDIDRKLAARGRMESEGFTVVS